MQKIVLFWKIINEVHIIYSFLYANMYMTCKSFMKLRADYITARVLSLFTNSHRCFNRSRNHD